MKQRTLRFWFCLGVATIAAAIADPLVECASNAGWFGPHRFTDHSNLDVLPALLAGVSLLVAYLALKVRSVLLRTDTPRDVFRELDRACGRAFLRLLPFAFALQMLALFAMESSEQLLIWGHLGGDTLWLGGPVAFSLVAHAMACCTVYLAAARLVSVMGATTLHVIRLVRALAHRTVVAPLVFFAQTSEFAAFERLVLAKRGIGERAPPLLTA